MAYKKNRKYYFFWLDGDQRGFTVDFLDERTLEVPKNFQGTFLFPHRLSVEYFNFHKLKQLPGNIISFKTEYSGQDFAVDKLKKHAPIPEELDIKIKALVMVRKNHREGLYSNGSLGHVVKIESKDGTEFIKVKLLNGLEISLGKEDFDYRSGDGRILAKAVNFPLTLAYATTIHKSQGATIDRVAVDISGLWEPGQAYVALSRAKTSEGIFIEDWDRNSIIADPDVIEFHERILEQSQTIENRDS
jgi:ATP-dependent DNA helicase PIF1